MRISSEGQVVDESALEHQITEDEKAAFERDGFLMLPGVLAPDQLSGEVAIVARVILSMTRLLIRATPARLVAIGAQAATVVRSQTAPRCVRHPTVAITVLRRQALFGGMDVDANVDIDGTEQRALLVLGLILEVIVIDADLVSTNRPIPTVIASALWMTATTMPTTM